MMIFLMWFVSLQILIVNMRVIPQPDELNATKSQDIVEETQHAICKISSKDLEATANATITRQLKGVATTSHLDDRMNILERTVILEMNNIKEMLEQFVYLLHKTNQIEMNNMQSQSHQTQNIDINQLEFKMLNQHRNDSIKTNNNNNNREMEILNLNMTIQKDNSSIKFLYFWRIDNFMELLSTDNAVESGDFYFAGNHLFIRLIPNYLQSEHLLLEVVEIEKFQLAHKFILVDQQNAQFDKISETLYCGISEDMEMQCAAFEISHVLLLSRNYIKNKTIIVQLVIYLDY